jgi:hypothetical protein
MQILNIWTRTSVATGGLALLLFCGVLPGGIARGTCMEAMTGMEGTSAPAQSSDASPSAVSSAGWNSAGSFSGEITVLATIRQVMNDHAAGGPAGIHLLVDGPLGSFDASLGSYLPTEVRQAISNGQPVQITGVVRSANGKAYLFARQLTVGGHQVVIRNANGFLVRTPSSTDIRSNKVRSEGRGSFQNGGIQ